MQARRLQLGNPSGVSVGRLCNLAEPAMVLLALDSVHLPAEGEGVVGRFGDQALGFRD